MKTTVGFWAQDEYAAYAVTRLINEKQVHTLQTPLQSKLELSILLEDMDQGDDVSIEMKIDIFDKIFNKLSDFFETGDAYEDGYSLSKKYGNVEVFCDDGYSQEVTLKKGKTEIVISFSELDSLADSRKSLIS